MDDQPHCRPRPNSREPKITGALSSCSNCDSASALNELADEVINVLALAVIEYDRTGDKSSDDGKDT